MKPNEEIMEFLKENPTFYLATVDGYLPRVRPIGFAMWYNGHLCIALGKHKAAYKQLLDNTNLEICAANDRGEWLRVQGTANFDNSPEAQAAAFQVMPQLADMYNEETGNKLGIMKANCEVALKHPEIGESFKAYLKELVKTLD